jgi:hypothetical protein
VLFRESLKIFELYSTIAQITIHHRGLIQHSQRRSKPNPIKAPQNGRDVLSKFAIETSWNAVWSWCGLVLHPPLLSNPRRSNTPEVWLRLRRAVVFCAVAIGPRDQPWGCPEETRNGMQVGKKNHFHKRSQRSRRQSPLDVKAPNGLEPDEISGRFKGARSKRRDSADDT